MPKLATVGTSSSAVGTFSQTLITMQIFPDESYRHRLWTGRGYKEWMRQNSLSQKELQERAYAESLPLHNSSISLFQRGTSMPKPEWFVYLGKFNEHIHLFTDLEPFYVYVDGEEIVAKDYHFFRMFTGSLDVPERYLGRLNNDKSKIGHFPRDRPADQHDEPDFEFMGEWQTVTV